MAEITVTLKSGKSCKFELAADGVRYESEFLVITSTSGKETIFPAKDIERIERHK